MNSPKDLNAPSRWNMRIWDDDKKEWLCQSDKEALTYYGFDITGGVTTEFQGLPTWHPNRHLIWEQSTGLKDKNGKEIYGGDILEFGIGGARTVGFVGYSDDFASYEVYSKNGYIIRGLFGCIGKVIGNIHENPELLGGKDE